MISISQLGKAFGENKVLSNLSLEIGDGMVYSVVGPSGGGKSTLLNLVAGLDVQDEGSINVDSPGRRLGYMTQNPLLLPWRTLLENARLGLEVVDAEDRSPRDVNRLFEHFGLLQDRNVYPHESSGGMTQRVALIRTLLIAPSLLLLDEPFSNLDFDIKVKVQRFLMAYRRANNATIVLVTHDIEDAIALSDTITVLSGKPASVKMTISVDLGLTHKDPVEARKSPHFAKYFADIWDELKHLENDRKSDAAVLWANNA